MHAHTSYIGLRIEIIAPENNTILIYKLIELPHFRYFCSPNPIVLMMMAIHMHVRICGCQTSVDSEYRLQFQGWINQLWEDKDALLEQMHREYPGK